MSRFEKSRLEELTDRQLVYLTLGTFVVATGLLWWSSSQMQKTIDKFLQERYSNG